MITATIKLHGRPEKRREILLTIKGLVNKLSKGTNCDQVKLYQEIDDENTFFLVEDWPSNRDLNEYLSSQLFKVLLGVHPILEDPMEIKLFTEVEKSDLKNDSFVKDQQH